MRLNDRLVDNNNNEVILFPMEYMSISNAEHNVLAIDYRGWDEHGRVYNCECYAPFSGTIIFTGNDHNMIYWSDNPVLFADGTVDYATILVAHSMTAPTNGLHFTQGDVWYHTGNYGNSTGDHLHMEIAKGHVRWNSSGTGLLNPCHSYDAFYINNTNIVQSMYTWKIYEGGHTPDDPTNEKKRKKFPWHVIYVMSQKS